MAPKQQCAKYQYVVTPTGPKILPVEDEPCKDEESPADYNAGGYLPVKVGDTFSGSRYRVVRKLGWGHFSTVWLVKDNQTQRHSALKVVKSAGRYAETARDEIKLLSKVASISPEHPGRNFIVSFLDSFSHQGPESSHVCIVFEPLGENLLALIERHRKKGVPRALVRVIAKQILLGLEYLHDECDLVHTDIKPENILISIPDIEAHIHCELSQSPSPTSRRVGVPLPTKTRAGVTIPYSQQRSRRQVQIFESQPLSSPGKSLGRSANGSSLSTRGLDTAGSGNTSQPGSYIPPGLLSRTGSTFNGSTTNFCSSAPKISSPLSTSAPRNAPPFQQVTQNFAAKGITAVPTRVANCPSTSSSSSSISSVLASATAGSSSIVSTPPTSLSHSLGNTLIEFMGGGKLEAELRNRIHLAKNEDNARVIVPTRSKATVDLEYQLSCAMSTACTNLAPLPGAKQPVSTSLKSNHSDTAKKARLSHTRSHSGISGISASKWQDPGTAAPAPAVLISAVANADAHTIPSSELPTATSSGCTTLARPSPSGTPLPTNSGSELGSADSQSKAAGGLASDTRNNVAPVTTQVSLLTQTAPQRPNGTVAPLNRPVPRPSPPQQVSQLSAHMHVHRPQVVCNLPKNKPSSRPARTFDSSPPPEENSKPSQSSPSPSDNPAPPPPTPTDTEAPSLPHDVATGTIIAQPAPVHPPLHLQTIDGPPLISIKIADLGNATPSKKHYTEDIQTRQYRAPEAILGRKDWDARADIWSVACVVFELLTAEYLFDPQRQGELFTKDDDHMAQIIELLGDFPLEVKMGGKYSRELFDHAGALRYIKTLKPWPLERVMIEKYLFSEADSRALCDFLLPMLTTDMRDRANARDMKDHAWLQPHKEDGTVLEW